ncbi:phage terminase large subunit family protein [Candidatus Babeliales bacterium]|nr:phage terminase large subunit family protein [Candidatus Babeliales bacterium]
MTVSNDTELKRLDPMYWVMAEGIKNEKNKPMSFDGFYYLKDIYNDHTQKIVIMKSAQTGISTWAIICSLHSALYHGINQIHTLPTGADVQKFVPSKVNEIIKHNKCLQKAMTTEMKDSVKQKQIGRSFLFYAGTHAERESIMITSDRNWYDEYDRSDMKNVRNYHSRLEGEDSLKQERWFSTPTVPEFGVDDKWLQSDQKHWRFPCPHCSKKQFMDWPDNIDIDGGRYMCKHCAGTLEADDIKNGKWQAKYPGREISGYWINQMMSPWIKPKELIESYKENKKEGTLDYFFNFKIGKPYVIKDAKLNQGIILRNITSKEIYEKDSFMGVDVQLGELYAIIGNKDGVFAIARIIDEPGNDMWDQLAVYMDLYDVRTAVIDAGYKPGDVLAFCKRFPGRAFMNWYKENKRGNKVFRYHDVQKFTDKKVVPYEESIKILTDRERAIDRLVAILAGDNEEYAIRFAFSKADENLQMLISHTKVVYSRIVETPRLGEKKKEWTKTGKDDLFQALVYFTVAVHKTRTQGSNTGA